MEWYSVRVLGGLIAVSQLLWGSGAKASRPDVDGMAPITIMHSGPVTRRLRGDWESPDMVALTYSTAWPGALHSIVNHLASRAPVLILLPVDAAYEDASILLETATVARANTHVAALDVDTAWIRDYGPLQTRDVTGRIIWLDADYSSRPSDDQVPPKLATLFDVPLEVVPEGLEGGALISNGRGLCVSTFEAFQQNGISIDEVDATDALLEQLGCRVVVLALALTRDQTKHADMFAQFLTPEVVAIASFNAITAFPDAIRMDQSANMIAQAARLLDQNMHVVRVPHPDPEGEVYYSYLNGLRVGDSFLVPQYRRVSVDIENRAYDALTHAAPHLELLPVPSDDLIVLNGAVHCITLGLSLPRGGPAFLN